MTGSCITSCVMQSMNSAGRCGWCTRSPSSQIRIADSNADWSDHRLRLFNCAGKMPLRGSLPTLVIFWVGWGENKEAGNCVSRSPDTPTQLGLVGAARSETLDPRGSIQGDGLWLTKTLGSWIWSSCGASHIRHFPSPEAASSPNNSFPALKACLLGPRLDSSAAHGSRICGGCSTGTIPSHDNPATGAWIGGCGPIGAT